MEPIRLRAILFMISAALCAGGCGTPRQEAPSLGPSTTRGDNLLPSRPAPSEQPTTVPADMTFSGTQSSTVGRVALTLQASDTIALRVNCNLPKPVDQEIRRSVGAGLNVRLALTRLAVRSIIPSGSPPPPVHPSEYQDAVEGTLICTPTANPREVVITLKDLRFPATKIRQIGPMTVQLDNPPPP